MKPNLQIFSALENYKYIGTRELLVIRILEEYNCRVMEVLNAQWVDLYPGKFLVLRGLKHSRNVIVRDPDILLIIQAFPRLHPTLIFWPTKYRRIYELCSKALGSKVFVFKKKKNNKVTHYFRYANVEPIDNEAQVQDILSHNSRRSSAAYKQSKKGK